MSLSAASVVSLAPLVTGLVTDDAERPKSHAEQQPDDDAVGNPTNRRRFGFCWQ